VFALDDFSIAFGTATVVDRLSLQIRRGETLALVGESGSGKSVSALGALGLLPANARISGGRRLGDNDLS
ncbi:ATP-binding cassette domain-containing protein, partial [Campylobacter jejuni]